VRRDPLLTRCDVRVEPALAVECGPKQTRLGERKVDVRAPGGVHKSARIECVISGRTLSRDLGLHRGRQLGERPAANRSDQVRKIGEMPVRRVGRDADPAGSLAQHDRFWATLPRHRYAGINQRVAKVAVVIAPMRRGCGSTHRKLC